MAPHPTPSLAQGRLCIIVAAVLWSTGGAFTKVLTRSTPLGLDQPPLDTFAWAGYQLPVQIACYRVLFAALFFAPLVRWRDVSFKPLMIVMALSFTAMNITFVSAMALGTAASAIFLQYSAPLWMYLASVFLLGDATDRRGTISLFLGMLGIAVMVAGGWQSGELTVVIIALVSGLTFAGILICLRVLRHASTTWLTFWNHFWGGLILVPLLIGLRAPTLPQFATLFLYGSCQMGLAYWLMGRGLKVVNPQEAGTLSLLEPILNPIWVFLIAGERPQMFEAIGGLIIVGALAWRYWPRRSRLSE